MGSRGSGRGEHSEDSSAIGNLASVLAEAPSRPTASSFARAVAGGLIIFFVGPPEFTKELWQLPVTCPISSQTACTINPCPAGRDQGLLVKRFVFICLFGIRRSIENDPEPYIFHLIEYEPILSRMIPC